MVPAVDGFRGFAVLAVLLYHVVYAAGRPALDDGTVRNVLISGYIGVDFFFVISGFVLFLPVVCNGGEFGSVRSYAIRRAARILPALYVVLLVIVVFHPLLTSQQTDLPYESGRGLLSFALHLTLLQHTLGLILGLHEGFLAHGALWTLTVEFAFYILLPLIAARYYRHPFFGLAIAVAVSVIWRLAVVRSPITLPWSPDLDKTWLLRITLVTQLPTYLAHFAAGMTTAWLFVRLRGRRSARQWVTVPVQIAAGCALVMTMSAAGARDMTATAGLYDHWTRTTHVAFLFALLLLATVLGPRWAQIPVTNVLARRLGDISYGVYLWHLILIGFAFTTLEFAPDGTNAPFWRMLAFALPTSVAAGWLSWAFLERPWIAWSRRRTPQRDARRTSEGSPGGLTTAPPHLSPPKVPATTRLIRRP